MIKKYLKIWFQLTNCAFSSYASNRLDSFSFFAGKIVRFGFFLLLIFAVFNYTQELAGYSKYEVILFFLTFNLVDVLAQAFFRGIYMFKNDVRKGNFDYVLSKPVNSLFYSLSRLTDILDFLFLIPLVVLIIGVIWKLKLAVTVLNIFGYVLFLVLGVVLVIGFHILSACFTMLKSESDNVIWLYREAMTLGRFPPEVYSPVMQFIFTFFLPVIIAISFPAKVLLGALSWPWMLVGAIVSILFFAVSVVLWKVSLRYYSSASS